VVEAIDSLKKVHSMTSQAFTSAYLYHMDLGDINYYLYCAENEERELWGGGLYEIPGFGKLVFGGFGGLAKILRETSVNNDFDHPLYRHLKDGNFLLEYYEQRLTRYKKPLHAKFVDLFKKMVAKIKLLPVILRPNFFHRLISLIISAFENKFLEHIECQDFFFKNIFFRKLLLTIPQFLTATATKGLYLPSAGLPHFTVGCWKNWGRDTFISFNGIFLLTGLYPQGRAVILEYARYLRHGLIPNMLDPPRYNSRDATWWFIYAIKNYLEESSDYKILEHKVDMIFLSDDQAEHFRRVENKEKVFKKLVNIVQEIFERHAQGTSFREWNAPKIDDNMSEEGFNVSLSVDWRNGFVTGEASGTA
jgi:glycogen debranching enzyme